MEIDSFWSWNLCLKFLETFFGIEHNLNSYSSIKQITSTTAQINLQKTVRKSPSSKI